MGSYDEAWRATEALERCAAATGWPHYRAQALAILTVSDNIISGAKASSEQRERGFTAMAKLALEIAPG